MLPPATQSYLRELFPDQYRLRLVPEGGGDPEIHAFELTTRWAGDERDPVYPMVALQLSPTGVVRDDEMPNMGLERTRENTDPTVAYDRIREWPLYDELTVTLATKGHHNPTSSEAHERMSVLASDLAQFARTELRDGLRTGTGYNVIPATIPQGGVSEMTDVSGLDGNEYTQRRTFTVQLNYTLADVAEIDAVAGFDATVVLDDHRPRHVEVRWESTA